jgi:cell division septation protein DedD
MKHKLLALFSAVALVIIIMPLFQPDASLISADRLIKSPPFPDQSIQVAIDSSAAQPNMFMPSTAQLPAYITAHWAVEVGHFTDNANALRLVNLLRTSGYRAFTQRNSTHVGNTTSVFIGPEAQQTTAVLLAQQLSANLHIDGIVVSYKPFAL